MKLNKKLVFIVIIILLTSVITSRFTSEGLLLARESGASEKPLKDIQVFDEYCCICETLLTGKSFVFSKGKYYCEDCSWDYVTTCELCNNPVNEGIISSSNKLFCEDCYENYFICSGCGEPVGPKGKKVGDGCYLCKACISDAVLTYEELSPIYLEATNELKNLGLSIFTPVSDISILSKDDLVTAYGDGASGDETAFVEYVDSGYRIYILKGLSYKEIVLTLCHELAHIWDDENLCLSSLFSSEGFAEWIAYKVMLNRGYLKEAKEMYLNPDDVYGAGLRYVIDLEKEYGFSGTISYLENNIEEIDWYYKGCVLFEKGEFLEAIDCFDHAIEIDPRDSEAWFEKGMAYYELGRYDEELACYEEVIKINPKDSDAWYNKGCVLYENGRFRDAIECLDEVLELEPDAKDAIELREDALNKLHLH